MDIKKTFISVIVKISYKDAFYQNQHINSFILDNIDEFIDGNRLVYLKMISDSNEIKLLESYYRFVYIKLCMESELSEKFRLYKIKKILE